MRNQVLALIALSCPLFILGQDLEVAGAVKVGGKITNITDPEDAQDAATKAYVDNILLSFALETIVDTSQTVQGLLNAGIAPTNIFATGIDSSYFIGLNYAGGIIFYMRADGKGLVAAPTDQSTNAEWGCVGTDLPAVPNVPNPPSGSGAEIGDGSTNTTAILSGGNCPAAPAALACTNYMGGGFSDWFLPSINELNEMYVKIGQGATGSNQNIGSFAASFYWSSSEFDGDLAWGQTFNDGFLFNFDKDDGDLFSDDRVRAIRAF